MDSTEKWLNSLDLGQYARVFAENDVDLDVLPELSEEDLKELGVSLGHRKKLFIAIAALRGARLTKSTTAAANAASRAREADAANEPERRQLTVMFCDLVGFTAMASRLDPEDLREVVRAYQSACTTSIEYYDGYVSRYMGDGILAFFGFPNAHEEDAERAVLAGLDALEALKQVNEGIAREKGVRVAARIGIATGIVVVGDLIGKGTSEELAVTGGTANLANRIQHVAKPDTVVIAQSTRELAGDRFHYEDLGEPPLKGIAEPVRVWMVTRERSGKSRFDAVHGTNLSPLVGRQEELELLRKRWEQVKKGDGQVVLISGEPGIGKSRLTRSLRERIAPEPHEFLCYQCSPFYTNSALHPLTRQLSSAARFSEDDSSVERLGKLERLVRLSSRDMAIDMPLIAALMSVPTLGRYQEVELDPKRQKEEILAALMRQLEGLSSVNPVLCIFEDLQWVDPSTLALLNHCIQMVRNMPVLMALTFRPEFEAPWTREAHTTFMAVRRMQRRDTVELVQNVAGNRRMPAEVLEPIVDKTDGVPLFVEEFTKTVLESGLLEDAGDHFTLFGPLPPLAIPASLHDSLMARLDRMGSAKDVVQMASALGRTFSYRVLSAISQLPEDALQSELDQLVSAELIHKSTSSPDGVYEFKHALVQQEAYDSMVRRKRCALHDHIARTLLNSFPDRVENEPELLARHFEEAGDTRQSMEFWLKAGRRSAGRSDFAEARAQLQRTLELLRQDPPSPVRDRQELQVLITLGAALAGSGAFSAPGSGKVYRRALELCKALGDVPEIFPVLSGAGSFYVTCAEFDEVRRIAGDCLSRAERQDSLVGRVIGHRLMGGVRFLTGDLVVGCEELDRVLELVEGENALFQQSKAGYALDHKATALCYLALARTASGQVDKGLEAARESLRHSESTGNLHSVNYALCYLAAVHHMRRDDSEALEIATRSRDMALEHGFASWVGISRGILGEALVRMGHEEEGLAEVQGGLANHREINAKLYLPFALALHAKALISVSRLDQALEALEEALQVAAGTGERWFLPELHRLQGVVHASSGRPADAEQQFSEALGVAGEMGGEFWALKATVALVNLLQSEGRHDEAGEKLDAIRLIVGEAHVTLDFVEARALLAGSKRPHGNLRLLRG